MGIASGVEQTAYGVFSDAVDIAETTRLGKRAT
jgi:hypothetical protein